VEILLDKLVALGIVSSLSEIGGVGHRVLHGKDKYKESVVVTDEVIEDIKSYSPLGPLHNPANALGMEAVKEVLPDVPMTAVFDTTFHQTMEPERFLYPVPYTWYSEYGVRKYGFHGTSHAYIAKTCKELFGENKKIISCHLGNGSSLCAIKDGKCIDTSMGFTPLAGVMMGTRSGDVDPSIIPYVMEKTGETAAEVVTDLNKKSGMLALSGISSDMRDIEEAYVNKDPRCVRAMNMYIKHIANYLSMYNTLLEGADYIVFTAGVGENSNVVRKLVIDKFKYLGVKIDEEKNDTRGITGEISTEDSTIKVVVLPTNEELMIAKDTYNLVNQDK
jgi:acetate kinase